MLRLQTGQLGVTAMPGDNLLSNTLGLLGTYDSKQDNDLTFPNGTTISINSSPEDLYNYGNSCKTKAYIPILDF